MKKAFPARILLLVALSLTGCPTPITNNGTGPTGDNATYTVAYNGNSAIGTPPADPNKYLQGQTVTVLGMGSLTKAGLTFTGWNTQQNLGGITYAINQTFTMGNSNIALYASWTSLPTYKVTYSANGGSGTVPTDPNSYAAGQTVTVASGPGDLTKLGFVFVGWNTQPDGSGTSYMPSQTFKVGSTDVTIYAEWNPTYTVYYDTDGGVLVYTDPNNYAAGQSVMVQGNPNNTGKPGYALAGWNTQPNGTGTTYLAGQTFQMASGNVILSATWVPSTPGLVFELAGNYVVKIGYSLSGSVTVPGFWNAQPVTSIGNGAFASDAGLTAITVAASVQSIGSLAFFECVNLTSLTLPSSLYVIGQQAFLNCTGLLSVTFPSGLTNIADQAFDGCTGLTTVILPSSVSQIGAGAFSYCTNLTTVVVNSTTPPTSDTGGMFANCPNLTAIKVPPNSVSTYQNDQNWSAYKSLIVSQ